MFFLTTGSFWSARADILSQRLGLESWKKTEARFAGHLLVMFGLTIRAFWNSFQGFFGCKELGCKVKLSSQERES